MVSLSRLLTFCALSMCLPAVSCIAVACSPAETCNRPDDPTTLPPTEPLDMPVSGSARYLGAADLTLGVPASYAGRVDTTLSGVADLTAAFDTDQISGTMRSFSGPNQGAASGSLAVVDGTISGNSFGAATSGTLVQNGIGVDINGTSSGTFRGPNAEALTGTISGTAEFPNSDTTAASGAFDGVRN